MCCVGPRSPGEFVEADGDGLAQIHGGLSRLGGDFDEDVAVRQIFACKTVLFRAEYEGNATAVGQFALDDGGQIGQCDDRLLGLAIGQSSGADDKRAIGNCLD